MLDQGEKQDCRTNYKNQLTRYDRLMLKCWFDDEQGKTVTAAITLEKIKIFLIGSGSLLSMRRAAAHGKPKIQTPRKISKDPSAIIDKESGVFGCKPVERFKSAKSVAL